MKRPGTGAFTLIEMVIVIMMSTLLYAGVESVLGGQKRLDLLAGEKLLLTGAAQWAAREVVAAPKEYVSGRDAPVRLARRMERVGLPAGLGYALTATALGSGLVEVTVEASRVRPPLGRVAAGVVVIVHE